MTTFVCRNARVVTMNDRWDIVHGDVLVTDGRIVSIAPSLVAPAGTPELHFDGDWLVPGFVQTHIHLTQTLFRHCGEDRVLLRWLRERIWPLEGAHTPETNAVSAELGIGELLLSGTTCLLDMGTVHHEDAIAQVLATTGIRAAFGKAMMDAGQGVPDTLLETTHTSIDESVRLARQWHGFDNDRLRYAFAPRFVLSCTPELQREIGRLSQTNNWLIHTHASEQVEEIEAVQQLFGQRNIDYLHSLGLTGPRSVFAHCVHVSADERALLARTGTTVCHCPSSNLKLGSGIADLIALRADGVNVGIGADGAPCNNSLDTFVEMRLAHLLQCYKHHPGALAPRDVLYMATRAGARALGWEDRIGSIEPGKDADLVRIRRADFRNGASNDPYLELVCSGHRDLVRDVWVRGRQLVHDGRLTTLDGGTLRERADVALRDVLGRAGIA